MTSTQIFLDPESSVLPHLVHLPPQLVYQCRPAVNVPGMRVHVYTRARKHAVVSAFVKLITSCGYQHLGMKEQRNGLICI